MEHGVIPTLNAIPISAAYQPDNARGKIFVITNLISISLRSILFWSLLLMLFIFMVRCLHIFIAERTTVL